MPTLKEKLHDVLAPIVAPGQLINADQSGPRPARPYATLAVRSQVPQRHLIRSAPDAAGVAVYREDGRATVEVQLYGEEAYERGRALLQRLRAHGGLRRAEALGLAVERVLDVVDATELVNQQEYEERAIAEFTVAYAETFEEEIGLIERADIQCGDHTHVVNAPPRAP